MARPIIIRGPLPPEGSALGWCAVCMARWKQCLILDVLKLDDEWFEAHASGDATEKPSILAPPSGAKLPPLEEGVTIAPVTLLRGMAVVCWTHADALGPAQPGPSIPAGPNRLIPGLS